MNSLSEVRAAVLRLPERYTILSIGFWRGTYEDSLSGLERSGDKIRQQKTYRWKARDSNLVESRTHDKIVQFLAYNLTQNTSQKSLTLRSSFLTYDAR